MSNSENFCQECGKKIKKDKILCIDCQALVGVTESTDIKGYRTDEM